MLSGGLAWLRHHLLRRLLVRADMIPSNYVRFLEYAVEHMLLRKFGRGHMFLHRIVLDYFANLEIEPQNK